MSQTDLTLQRLTAGLGRPVQIFRRVNASGQHRFAACYLRATGADAASVLAVAMSLGYTVTRTDGPQSIRLSSSHELVATGIQLMRSGAITGTKITVIGLGRLDVIHHVGIGPLIVGD